MVDSHQQHLSTVGVDAWESAYLRFETPDEEIAKFLRRLKLLGAPAWPKDAHIVELFCGRGNGMVALEQLGFTQVEGVDLSARLLKTYAGSARTILADCRRLPFESESRDIAVVQGGLHHLSTLPDDLEQSLNEVRRILRPGGLFVVVEPWNTPFLRVVNHLAEYRLLRRISVKVDALGVMTDNEYRTYYQWLGQPRAILSLFDDRFHRRFLRRRWGKLMYVGEKRSV